MTEQRLRVLICDDEDTALSIIAASVESLLASRGFTAEVTRVSSAEACLRYLTEHPADIAFLDICMPDMDGIELGRRLEKQRLAPETAVVFVSSNQERMHETFQLRPFGFVRKHSFMGDIVEVMNRYLESLRDAPGNGGWVEVRDRSGVTSLRADNILYAESLRNTQTVHLVGGTTLILHTSMDKLAQSLAPLDFIRVHKGFAVNCAAVRSFGRTEIILSDRSAVPVGRMYYQSAISAYMDYVRTRGAVCLGG